MVTSKNTLWVMVSSAFADAGPNAARKVTAARKRAWIAMLTNLRHVMRVSGWSIGCGYSL